MNRSFTKLFSSIVTSTIWREDDKTRLVWITLLALADQFGEVAGSIPGLAALANVAVDECGRALEKLMSPDPYSRTKEYEGRRIEVVEGGWRLLNYQRYRALGSAEDRREYQRQWDRDHRPSGHARWKMDSPTQSDNSPTQSDTTPTGSDAVRDKQKQKQKQKKEDNTLAHRKADERVSDPLFARFWESYPRKIAKQAALKAFHRLDPDEALLETMLTALDLQKVSPDWQRDGGQFIPYPATWVNGRRWEDERVEPETAQSMFERLQSRGLI